MTKVYIAIIAIYLISLIDGQSPGRPVPFYDGVSRVRLLPSDRWNFKYALGPICEDAIWTKTVTIDIRASTSEADLVFAFGTSQTYFAAVIGYDGKIVVPLDPWTEGEIFVTPPSGNSLREAVTTLEQQYRLSDDFRESLINFQDQTTNWQKLLASSVMGENGSPLTLTITGNRNRDITQLTVTKNGVSSNAVFGSTWRYDVDLLLFLGTDAIENQVVDEIFVMNGITTNDICSFTPRPTPSPTTTCDCYQTLLTGTRGSDGIESCYGYQVTFCDDNVNAIVLGNGGAPRQCGLNDISSVVTSVQLPASASYNLNYDGLRFDGIQISGLNSGDRVRICFDATKVSGTLDGGGNIQYQTSVGNYVCPATAILFDLCPGVSVAAKAEGFDIEMIEEHQSRNTVTYIWAAIVSCVVSMIVVFIGYNVCIKPSRQTAVCEKMVE